MLYIKLILNEVTTQGRLNRSGTTLVALAEDLSKQRCGCAYQHLW